jgi:hypothetical protein
MVGWVIVNGVVDAEFGGGAMPSSKLDSNETKFCVNPVWKRA